MITSSETFTCANCKEEFSKQRSDAVALDEMYENFPDEVDDGQPVETVCEDCYNKMAAFYGWKLT